ncbi:MAG: GPR endopeptidase [Clostridia bacterium]|nr:GPR endopeptidase [Clostridia bacterium]
MAEELHGSRAGACEKSGGIESELFYEDGIRISRIKVISKEGAEAIGKPQGAYVTLSVGGDLQSDGAAVFALSKKIAENLRPLLPEEGEILVAGLGNRFITPDSLGPKVIDRIIVTRHLMGEPYFSGFRPVCAISAGVLGCTGVETAEIIKGVCSRVRPAAVVAIDSLASLSVDRLCRSFQISDTGIVPGAGAYNARRALDRQTLGVPVVALGVPTVVDAETIVSDALKSAGADGHAKISPGLLVTPKDIDALIQKSAKALSYGINMAIQGDISISDIEQFLG